MASSSTTETPSIEQAEATINLGSRSKTVQLGDDNYLLWRFQVLTAIEGHGLDSYIEEDQEPPSKYIGQSNARTLNPAFVRWKRQDKLLSSWLIGSMTEGILSEILDCETSREIWIGVQSLFTYQNLAKVMQFKTKMQNLKKEGLSMKEFLAKLKAAANALSSVGHKVSEEDHSILEFNTVYLFSIYYVCVVLTLGECFCGGKTMRKVKEDGCSNVNYFV